MTKKEKDFKRGFAYACAISINSLHNKYEVEETYSDLFMTAKQLKEIGLDDGYIDSLKPIIREIERKRKIKM